MNFNNILGHEVVKQSLTNDIIKQRISNAYIFEGIEGVGKRLCARIFSCALVCKEVDSPCGKCPICIQAKSGTLPDIVYVTKDKDKASISVDNIREQVISEVYLKPMNASRKIFIIELGDILSTEAQNALLKVLEEPPSYVTFIICVTSKEKLLPTVLSRSQTITFFPVSTDIVCDFLMKTYCLEYNDAYSLAKLSGGSIGVAKKLQEDTLKKVRIDKSIALLINLKKNSVCIREMVDFLSEERENIQEIIEYLMTFIRDCIMIKTNLAENTVFLNKVSQIRVFCDDISKKRLVLAFDRLSNLKLKLKQNLNFNATVSETIMRLWEDFHDKSSGHQI